MMLFKDDAAVSTETLQYWFQFNLDKYYEKIKDYTFESRFIPVTRKDADAWRKFNSNKLDTLSEADKHDFLQLQEKIDKEIALLPRGSKAFVKLSSRSPKDAVDKLPRTVEILAHLLREHPEAEKDDNKRLILLRRAFFFVMAVSSGKEAFEIFAASGRTVADIARAVQAADESKSKDTLDLQLVVRRFYEITWEFRGFVFGGKLCALTQYDRTCYFEEIVQRKEHIQRLCFELFQKLQPLLAFDSYIIDFALLPDDTVRVVELNPYGEATGSILLDWSKDKKVLEGELPFEFRVITEPQHPIQQMLPWKPLVLEAQERNRKGVHEYEAQQEKCIVS